MQNATQLPDSILRADQIHGNPKKGLVGLIPMAPSTWWVGVKAGIYPQPVKLGKGLTGWRRSDIEKLIQNGIDAAANEK